MYHVQKLAEEYNRTMEVWTLKIGNVKNAPFTGSGIVVMFERTDRTVRLLHPWSMTVWEMPLNDLTNKNDDTLIVAEGFEQHKQELLWSGGQEPNACVLSLLKVLGHKIEEAVAFKRDVPLEELSQVLAVLKGEVAETIKADLLAKLPHQGARMEAKSKAAKKGVATRKEKAKAAPKPEPKYVATDKLNVDDVRGQGKIVAEILKRRTVPADLADLTEAVKSHGGYKLKPNIKLADSVRYHLNKFAADSAVTVS